MGIKPSEARAVASCHLHIDHSGNNYRFPVTPIFVQRAERDAASTTLDYSLPDTIAFREARGCSFNETSDDARARAACLELDPWRVTFAHDLSIWERGA